MRLLKRLMELGVHIGHHKDSLTCFSSNYVVGIRNGRAIIDLNLTLYYLRYALWFIKKLGALGGHLLFHNSCIDSFPLVVRMFLVHVVSIKHGFSLAETKWQYGQLSNFYYQAVNLIKELNFNLPKKYFRTYRLTHSLSLVQLLYKIMFYTVFKKSEGQTWRLHFFKMLKFWRFLHQFKYYNNFRQYPDALVFICPNNKTAAAREASARYLPVVSLIDTNSMHGVWTSYPIPSNDDSYMTTLFYFLIFIDSYLHGRTSHFNFH